MGTKKVKYMFSFFNKTPKSNNQPHIELAEMFWQDTTNPIFNLKFLEPQKLNFSIESLKHVDEYLELAHKEKLSDEDYTTIVIRVGSYLGEVVRKNIDDEYNWLDFKQAKKAHPMIKELGLQLGSMAVLWKEPDNLLFPFAKIDKYLTNGYEDSTYSLATVLLSQHNDSLKTI